MVIEWLGPGVFVLFGQVIIKKDFFIHEREEPIKVCINMWETGVSK